MRSTPAAGDIRVIVGDTHGDHVGMLQALRHVGAIDEQGIRAAGYWLCHVGDVIHAGHGVQHDDVVCLELALALFDCVLYGNHETPFAVGIGSFVGQNAQLDCQAVLDASVRDRRWLAATAVDGYLVCHAGCTRDCCSETAESSKPFVEPGYSKIRRPSPWRSTAPSRNASSPETRNHSLTGWARSAHHEPASRAAASFGATGRS